MEPIFKNTSQCVHFAYIFQAYSGTASSLAVKSVIRDLGHSGIDFGGMTPTEIHAQCTQIRDKVRAFLCQLHWIALEAKFQTGEAAREKAIVAMSEHLVTVVDGDRELIKVLAYRHYLPMCEGIPGNSVRAIAQHFGVSKDRVHRMTKLVERHVKQQEDEAFEALRERFEDSVWIGRQAVAA